MTSLSLIRSFWVVVKGDITCFILEFHGKGKLSKSINCTFIVLIPKVDSPQRLNDFRSILLVGGMYKKVGRNPR